MGRIIKRSLGMIIFAGIEAYFYFKYKPKDLEMFFMIWGLIAMAFLLYNIFNVKCDLSMMSLGTKNSLPHFTGSFLEKIYAKDRKTTRNHGGIRDPINLIYLLLVIVNIIGYTIVMPK
jgi:hypothetical protein